MLQYRAHLFQQHRHQVQLRLERMHIQLEQDREARKDQEQLLAMLTHELKTPLATMSMRLDPLAVGSDDMRRAIREMNGVIERCLQTNRLGNRGLEVLPQTLDVSALARDAIAACPSPQRIQTQLPDSLQITTDHQLLYIVLSNLLENACKYAAPDSPIVFQITPHAAGPDRIQCIISNQPGKSGWPDKDKLFSKYYRSAGAQHQAGTGLGLFLIANLLPHLKGRIDYAPDEHDVRFVLTLPITI